MSEFDHDNDEERRNDREPGVSRRQVLECMTWAGTGVLWTISGGVPRSLGLSIRRRPRKPSGLTFLQISDSHVGFDKPANPNALGTLEEAINRVKAMPKKPAFMIHTGDITHLSKATEFDDAERIISQARLDVHYVPGEHDFLDEEQQALSASATARAPRAPAGTASTPTACTSSASSTSSISRPAASAISAPSSSPGSRTTSRATRHRRRSWSSPTSRSGRSIRTGAGAPTTAPRRWII